MHNVMIFTEAVDPEKKVALVSYIAPKIDFAQKWFREDHPDKAILKIFSLGVKEYEIEASKYYALYKDT
jgi:hypothetical protein